MCQIGKRCSLLGLFRDYHVMGSSSSCETWIDIWTVGRKTEMDGKAENARPKEAGWRKRVEERTMAGMFRGAQCRDMWT